MVCDSDQLYQQYLAVWSVQKTKDLGLQKDAFEWKYSAENLRQTYFCCFVHHKRPNDFPYSRKIKEKYYEKCVKKVVTKSCLFVIYVFAFVRPSPLQSQSRLCLHSCSSLCFLDSSNRSTTTS